MTRNNIASEPMTTTETRDAGRALTGRCPHPEACMWVTPPSDALRFPLAIVREGAWWARLPARRERWIVLARTEQEAHRTVEYHFGLTALWYRLDAVEAPADAR